VDRDWERIPPDYPIEAAEVQAAIIGTDLFIFGGFVNDFANVTTASFSRNINAINSTWREMDEMPVAIGITHAAVVVIGMKLYMCGGYSGKRPGSHVPNCFIYDHSVAPGDGQWSAFTNLPNEGSAGGGMIYDSTKRMLYYAGGGQRSAPNSLDTTDVTDTWKISIDAPSNGWKRSTPFPYRANHLSSVTTRSFSGQERHFFVGGQLGENELTGNVGDLYEFLPSTETWVRLASLPSPRSHTAISTHAIGCGFIMAGGTLNSSTEKKNRTSEILYYDIPANQWATIGQLPSRGATPAVFLSYDYIYFVNHKKSSRSKVLQ
jgi:N-acetylneuraminic acid mutarotase